MSASKNQKAQNKPVGRPRGEVYYVSLKAAASAMGVPVETLSAARAAGADGMEGGRVYPEKLKVWLEAHKDDLRDTKQALERRKLLAQCLKVEFQNEVERGEYVARSVFATDLTGLATQQKSLLRQKLENELPGLIPELSPEQRAFVKGFNKTFVDQMCAEMQRLVDKWKI